MNEIKQLVQECTAIEKELPWISLPAIIPKDFILTLPKEQQRHDGMDGIRAKLNPKYEVWKYYTAPSPADSHWHDFSDCVNAGNILNLIAYSCLNPDVYRYRERRVIAGGAQ